MKDEGKNVDRRSFLASCLMWSGLAVGYGIGAFHFLKFLVPMGEKVRERELYVGSVDDLDVGKSKTVKTPSGETYVMARTAKAPVEESFRVLSDICPHLGCRVHWKADDKQFVCPCHMGIFDEEGTAISGPPAEAGQSLPRLKTKVRGRSVFVMIKES